MTCFQNRVIKAFIFKFPLDFPTISVRILKKKRGGVRKQNPKLENVALKVRQSCTGEQSDGKGRSGA